MGTFHTSIAVARNPDGPFEAVDALVDSGATYTLLPRPFLERLAVPVTGSESFVLADGTEHDLSVGIGWVRIEDRIRPTVIVFGPDDAEPLLGAVTVEEFALGIDPLRRELIRVRGYLVGLREDSTR